MGFLTRIGLPLILSRAIELAPVFPLVRSEILVGLLLTAFLTPELVGVVKTVSSACASICSAQVRFAIAITRRSLVSHQNSPGLVFLLSALSPRAPPVF